jgi:hypothetical protein
MMRVIARGLAQEFGLLLGMVLVGVIAWGCL